jgi:hypothetical protein
VRVPPPRSAFAALVALSLVLPACGGGDAAPAGREKADAGKCQKRKPTSNSSAGDQALRQLLYEEVKLPSGRTALLEGVSPANPPRGPNPVAGIYARYKLDVPVTYPGPGTVSHFLYDWGGKSEAEEGFDFQVESAQNGLESLELRERGGTGNQEYVVLGTENPGSFFSVYAWRDGSYTFSTFGSDEEDSSNMLDFWRCLDY